MAKDQANIFLVTDSLEHLEESKGAKLLIHYPVLIEEHTKSIEFYSEAIIQGEQIVNTKVAQYDELAEKKGLKAFFNKSKIKEQKAKLIADIKNWRSKIDEYVKEKNKLLKEVAQKKKEINEFVAVLINANIEPKDVIEEYYRIKKMLESGEVVETKQQEDVVVEQPAVVVEEQKNEEVFEENAEQVQAPVEEKKPAKTSSQKSAIDRFNSRMQKHKQIADKKSQGQPGL